MGKPNFSGFLMQIIFLIVFIGLIRLIFGLNRYAFYGNFLVLLCLLFFAFISVIGINNNQRWAWILSSIVMIFIFADTLFAFYLANNPPNIFMILVATNIAGFFISFFNIKKEREHYPQRSEYTSDSVLTNETFVAGRTGKRFHRPECNFVKRISDDSKVTFNTKDEAEKAGYNAHDCV